jgi:hypothetical protein
MGQDARQGTQVSGHGRKLPTGWLSWGKEMPLGFSFKASGVKAEMSPALRGEPALVEWRAVVTLKDVTETVWAEDHWRCADAVVALAADRK